jgi:hypothetical protein
MAAASTVWAQSQPTTGAPAQKAATSVEGLTVVAPRKYEPPHVQALNFVRSHGAPTKVLDQLARWTDPICPVTLGLSPEMNAFVSARVAALAAQAGAPLSKRPACKPNVEILFTDKPQDLVDQVAHKQSAFLGYHAASRDQALATVSRPIQAWYLTGTQNDNGQRSLDVAQGLTGNVTKAAGPGGDLSAMRGMAQTPEGCAGSHSTRCLSSLFVNVLIVADAKALDGRPIGPIADYIGLLALSQSRSLNGCDALPSILDLLSSGCGDRSKPDNLTEADVAYLKALYRTNLDTNLSVQKGQIADNMARSIEAPPER